MFVLLKVCVPHTHMLRVLMYTQRQPMGVLKRNNGSVYRDVQAHIFTSRIRAFCALRKCTRSNHNCSSNYRVALVPKIYKYSGWIHCRIMEEGLPIPSSVYCGHSPVWYKVRCFGVFLIQKAYLHRLLIAHNILFVGLWCNSCKHSPTSPLYCIERIR